MAQQVGQVSPDGRWLWNGNQWTPTGALAAPMTAIPWARPYESALKRSNWLTIFLLASIVSLVIGIVFDLVQVAFGTQSNDTQTIVVGLIAIAFLLTYVGTFIPSIVFFCMWVHRVVRNMPALGTLDPRWSPAGAVGRCFLPFLNLVHPMSGTLEAWRGSDSSRRWLNVSERKAMPLPGLIGAWWALWLIGGFVSSFGSRLSNNSDATTAATGDWIDAVGSLLWIGAAILAVLVVRDVTARQDRKNELISSGQLV